MSNSNESPQWEFSVSRVLHIFKNDVRRLWPQIVATFALMVLVIWTAPYHWLPWDQRPDFAKTVALPVLLPLAWCFLIIRVIHTDKLVGDRQFWVTRPYGWKNLLAAKVLFIVLAVNLPMLISDAIVLSRAGFAPTEYALGLIWRQALLTIVLVLPSVALATLTASSAQSRIEGLVFFGIPLLILLIFGGSSASGLYALDWVRTCLELLVLVLACIAILLWQYSRRERAIGYQLLAAGLALVGIIHIFMPWSALVSYEYSHPEVSSGFSSFQIDYDPDPALYVHQESSPDVPGSVRLQVPFRVSGLPDGYAVAGDAVKVTVETADHLSWHSHWENSGMITSSPSDDNRGVVDFTMSDWFFERAKSAPVKLHLTLALTLLKEHPVTVIATERPFRVPGVGICAVSGKVRNSDNLCRAPLRTPYQNYLNIDWKGSDCFSVSGNIESANNKIPQARSWSSNTDPLPAEFSVLPVVTFNLGGSSVSYGSRGGYVSYYVCPGVQLTFGMHKAVARMQRQLEIDGIRLTDYQIETSP